MATEKTKILDTTSVHQKLRRIAYQLYEDNVEAKELVIIGIAERGFILAQKIASILESISPIKVILHKLKLNKRDVLNFPMNLEPTLKVNSKTMVLVDDVLNSGKVLMFATRYLLQFDIDQLETVVLVDRRHRKYPIKANFVGLTLSTTLKEHISVNISIKGDKDVVYLE